jgi:2-oxoglutarate ferredoxin oxidoreductase subunit alpha
VKGIVSVEMSAGQMVEDIQLTVGCRVPVLHFGRMGGILPSPGEVAEFIEHQFIKV